MAYTQAQKYAFAQQVQDAASALAKAYRKFQDLSAVAQTRTFGDGGGQAITDADLNPNDTAIGKNLGISASQLFAVINYGYNQLNNLMQGNEVSTYTLGSAVNAIRDDV